MDLRFTPEETAFREEVRAFIDATLDPATRACLEEGRHPSKAQTVAWQKALDAKGWAVPDWPVEHGGTGWDPVRRFLFREALQSAPAPIPLQFNTLMVGPVIIAFGTPEQQARFLPRIRGLDDWWCQGFSEPGSGSDLASLKTRAVRDGDDYVVNGQKTWTTLAQHADWIFCLVRTDPAAKPQQGISFLLIDMKSPGITVRPIRLIDGGVEVNEVFFDDVRVPAGNLVGEENRGWDCAKFLLGNERSGQARVGSSKERVRRLRRLAAETPAGDGALIDDRRFAEKLASVEVELQALEMTVMRVVAREAAHGGGERKPDPVSSILKVRGSEIAQTISELYVEAAGPYALPAADPDEAGWNEPEIAPDWAAGTANTYFNWRKLSIYGGSNEIQRSIMAKAVLGL